MYLSKNNHGRIQNDIKVHPKAWTDVAAAGHKVKVITHFGSKTRKLQKNTEKTCGKLQIVINSEHSYNKNGFSSVEE